MLRSKRVIKVDHINVSGDDVERLEELCKLMEGSAQTIIDAHPHETEKVQNMVTFCRNVLKEFK